VWCTTCSTRGCAEEVRAAVNGAAEIFAVWAPRWGMSSCPAPSMAYRRTTSSSRGGLLEPGALRRHPLRPPREGPDRRARPLHALAAEGFGAETIRRVMLGTYALSAGYYDAYYGPGAEGRTRIIEDFQAAFADFDVLLTPTSPTVAFRLGERVDDPLAMYLSDFYTIPVNLAGNCAVSVPAGLSRDRGAADRPADHRGLLRRKRRSCAPPPPTRRPWASTLRRRSCASSPRRRLTMCDAAPAGSARGSALDSVAREYGW